MVIVDKTSNKEILFESLELEDVFKLDGDIFVKVSDDYDGKFNAYNFSEHELRSIKPVVMVQYIPSELILHERGWEYGN